MEKSTEQIIAEIKNGIDPGGNMAILWERYRLFVLKLAQKYRARAELDDLTQEGYIGLNNAVWHYNEAAGVSFLTYAAYWIRHQMQRFCEQNRGVKLPSHCIGILTKCKKIERQYFVRFGRDPDLKELAALTGYSIKQILRVKQAESVRSLDKPLGEDGDTLGDVTAAAGDPIEAAERALDRENMAAELAAIIDELPADQRAVVIGRYMQGLEWKTIERETGVKDAHMDWLRARRTLREREACLAYYEEYLAPADFRHVTLAEFKRYGTSQTERDAIRNMNSRERKNWKKQKLEEVRARIEADMQREREEHEIWLKMYG